MVDRATVLTLTSGPDGSASYRLCRPLLLSTIEPETRQNVVQGEQIQIPWSVALTLLDLYEQDDQSADQSARLPPYLTPDDVEILLGAVLEAGLPPRTPLRLQVRPTGLAGRPGYRLEALWRGAGDRPLSESPEVQGGLVIRRGSTPRRMSSGQYRTLEAIRGLAGLGQDRTRDLLATETLRAAIGSDTGVTLDPFLMRDRVFEVDALAPRLVPAGSGFRVQPQVPGRGPEDPWNNRLDDYLNREGSNAGERPVVVSEETERQRLVFAPRARNALVQSRNLGVLSPRQAARAMTHPEEVLGSDFDLSAFSERVVGIGPVIRRALPVLRETGGQSWWEWDDVALVDSEGDQSDGSSLDLRDPELVERLSQAVAEADLAGEAYLPHPGDSTVLIEITPQLREALQRAKDRHIGEKKPRVGLEVAENLEEVTFERGRPASLTTPEPVPLPTCLKRGVQLKPHQVEAYEWLCRIAEDDERQQTWPGGLLADDMGLGKTLVVLSFLRRRFERGDTGPSLVVLPLALMQNWQDEAARFFTPGAFEPLLPVRGADLPADTAAAAARLCAQRLVLVTYETLREREFAFGVVDWDVVVLDEAQKAKDPGTQVARVTRALKARFRLAMTGTPVENSLRDLWAMYEWASPGLLRSLKEFNETYIRPARDGDDAERKSLAESLQVRIGPWFLRRTKGQALGDALPPVNPPPPISPDPPHAPRVQHVSMSPEQEAAYTGILRSVSHSTGDALIGHLARLFGVLAHPAMASEEGPDFLGDEEFPKRKAFFETLRRIAGAGEKVIVFANRRRLQYWLASAIERGFDVPVSIINGEVSSSRVRLQRIAEFSDRPGFSAIILSPRAAGVGLNITAANHVIHYTREWNPAVEDQATSRAWRMGQTRPVCVHAFACTSPRGQTVDERLAELLDRKRKLARDFVLPMGMDSVRPEELVAGLPASS